MVRRERQKTEIEGASKQYKWTRWKRAVQIIEMTKDPDWGFREVKNWMQFLHRNMKEKTMMKRKNEGLIHDSWIIITLDPFLSIYYVLAIVLLLYMVAHFQQPKMVVISISFHR